ncbi:MAG: SH3 domain-containing protein [Bacteroidota bacterium]
MKKLLFLLLMLPSLGFSQVEPDLYFTLLETYGDQFQAPHHYMLADSVNMRACPGTQCQKKGLLRIGTPLTILHQSNEIATIKGIRSHWYEVKTADHQGWIWGGFIAKGAVRSHADRDIQFVFGLDRKEIEEGTPKYFYQIRAYKEHTVVAKLIFESYESEIHNLRNLGDVGVPNVKEVLVLDVPCRGGCGCTFGELVSFWDGKKMGKIIKLLGVGDAWASSSQELIYPIDMEGEEGYLIRVTSDYKDTKSSNVIERYIEKEYLKWNGQELVKDPSRKVEYESYLKTIGQ